MIYSLVALIWVIVAMYVMPCRKEIDRLYALDELDYELDAQLENITYIMTTKCAIEDSNPIPFNEYLSESVEDQNKLILMYVRNGIIGSIIYLIALNSIMIECNNFM